jgi:hypothetical protein
MLGVICTTTRSTRSPARAKLGIALTPLDVALRESLAGRRSMTGACDPPRVRSRRSGSACCPGS